MATKTKLKKSRKVPSKKASKPLSNHVYTTKIDEILSLIQKEGKISLEDLAIETDLSLEEVENWLKILQGKNLVGIEYPVMGKPYVYVIGKTKHEEVDPSEIETTKTRNMIVFGAIVFVLMMVAYYLFFM